ncbi:hypothetical protein E0198_005120 [Clavispora lusitaniae]|nr:hypothetical protein E0198_005120 [Clavispora lusitaniae]
MVLFVWGDGVCSWVDEHLLAGAPDRWDFRAVRAGRAVVHSFYSAGARAEEAAFSVVAAAADKLATPPHEHHAIVASGRDTIAYHLVRAAKEAARHGIFFVALFSPALSKRLEEYLLRQHEREKEQITARAQGASDAVRARVEARLGPFAEALHNEPVRCYVEVLRAEKEVHEQHEQMEQMEHEQMEEQEQQVEHEQHDSTDTQAEPVEVH